jgi:uncharacterized protein YjbJ (UPF0337 family)
MPESRAKFRNEKGSHGKRTFSIPFRAVSQKGILILQRCNMDKEHVKGATDKVVGKTKEVAGHAAGNKSLETEGKVDQVKGAVHSAAGDAKHAGEEAIEAVKNAPSKR